MKEYSEQEQVRRDKLVEIAKVCNPYPERYEVTHRLCDAALLEDGVTNVRVAGRIVFMRKMGKLSFLKLRDLEGDLQVSIKIDLVGEEKYAFFKSMMLGILLVLMVKCLQLKQVKKHFVHLALNF